MNNPLPSDLGIDMSDLMASVAATGAVNEAGPPLPDPDSSSLDDQKKEREKREHDQKLQHRGSLVVWVEWVTALWMLATFVLLFFSQCLGLSDTVLVTLITTTMVEVLALVVILLKSYFKEEKEKEAENNA